MTTQGDMATKARMCGDLRVLIVGGGIAGLTLAALMHQRGMTAEIVERSDGYGGVGYVLVLWPAGSDILKGMGLYPSFAEAAMRVESFEIRDGDGRILHTSSLAPVEENFGAGYFIERARLIEILRVGLPDETLRMGTTIDALEEIGESVRVHFSDGTSDRYDLVVGADGLRSRVRGLVFGDVPLRYLGLTGWAFWLPTEFVPLGTAREYWGGGHFVGLYPAPGALCAFVAAPAPQGAPDPLDVRLARLRATFRDMGGQVPDILASLSDPQRIWHDDFLDVRMETWHRGRVVLLGDAAHAILPTAGIGASMAMESAAVLAEELTRTDSRYIQRALERFEARRKRRVDRVQRDSRFLGRALELESARLVALRDAALRVAPEAALVNVFHNVLRGPI